MKKDQLGTLGRWRKLREQRSAYELGRERMRYDEVEDGFHRASRALDDNREKRRQREQQIYRTIRQKPVPTDQIETMRWELDAMELEVERLLRAVEESRAQLEEAAADVERAREIYLRHMRDARKWQKVVERAATGERVYRDRLAEFEQDDANVERIAHHHPSETP